MASKFLKHLRPSTLKDPRGPGPPEEPPETAELVDDPDMVVRLSGTLSLSEDSLASEESDGTGTELLDKKIVISNYSSINTTVGDTFLFTLAFKLSGCAHFLKASSNVNI